jgi:hypothetical protein
VKRSFVDVTKLDQLQPGDCVRHKNGRVVYFVTANYGQRVTAVSTADLTNPNEWEVLRPDPQEGV